VTAAPLELYDSAITAHTGSEGCRCTTWNLRYADGRLLPLALGRWCSKPDEVDLEILDRCADPTLDVGCGPGRLVAALNTAGRDALGVDIAPAAVQLARNAGARAMQGSVFDELPSEGEWGTALLIDGNIGIGGDPITLLHRCRELVSADGVTLVELDPPGERSIAMPVRLESHRSRSHWFDWAHVAANQIADTAAEAGLLVVESWTMRDRWFACLTRK
jgi:SAM-dependent methyltransferase